MLRRLLLLGALVGAFASGCHAQPDAPYARDYEGCGDSWEGDLCGDGPTVCREVEALDHATLCTMSCETTNDCEPLLGRDVRCVGVGAEGLCMVTCFDDDDCPWTTECAYAEDGDRGVCLPD